MSSTDTEDEPTVGQSPYDDYRIVDPDCEPPEAAVTELDTFPGSPPVVALLVRLNDPYKDDPYLVEVVPGADGPAAWCECSQWTARRSCQHATAAVHHYISEVETQ